MDVRDVYARVGRRGVGAGSARVVVAAAFLMGLAASAPHAQDAPPAAPPATPPESPLRALMKAAGLATDVSPPPDFVLQSRPARDPDPIPPFTKPPEPPGKAKSATEVDAIDSDLEAIAKRHDALRAAFPPSAKAVAEAAAAKKAKSKTKPAGNGLIPSF
jgi:hypothetical protein